MSYHVFHLFAHSLLLESSQSLRFIVGVCQEWIHDVDAMARMLGTWTTVEQ